MIYIYIYIGHDVCWCPELKDLQGKFKPLGIRAFRILDQNATAWYISSAWLIHHANNNSHDI